MEDELLELVCDLSNSVIANEWPWMIPNLDFKVNVK